MNKKLRETLSKFISKGIFKLSDVYLEIETLPVAEWCSAVELFLKISYDQNKPKMIFEEHVINSIGHYVQEKIKEHASLKSDIKKLESANEMLSHELTKRGIVTVTGRYQC